MPHSLTRLADGSLGYITRRIDRTKNGEKIDMEDMCQLTLLLNVAIANPKNQEEMALSINGKKSRIKLTDFLKASDTMGIDHRITLGLINKLQNTVPTWINLINCSFLSDEMKQNYINIINSRIETLIKDI